MSDQQVDLNAMIQHDRKRKHIEKQRHHQDRRRDYRDRDNRERRDDWHKHDRGQRRQHEHRHHKKQIIVETYALSVTGFVSDVSLDDILKMAKNHKIINIKASLSRQDGQPLQSETDTAMSVLINFAEKEEADDFIKTYSDKQLDGKNTLQFQFRRGTIIKKPYKAENDRQAKSNNKQEEQE